MRGWSILNANDDDDDDDDGGCVVLYADHITMKLAIFAENYELLSTGVTFYDCTVHSSYVLCAYASSARTPVYFHSLHIALLYTLYHN